MSPLPVLLAKQKMQAFSFLELIYFRRYHRKVVSRDAEHYGEAQNVVTSCFASQKGSASTFLLLMDSRKGVSRDEEQNGEVKNMKTARINQLQAGKG